MAKKRRPTLREVAAEAGVGLATASRALNRGRSISEEAQAKVLAAAKKLGYQPDPGMSRLAERRWDKHASNLNIAYLANSQTIYLQASFYEEEYARLAPIASSLGYQLLYQDISEFSTSRNLLRSLRNKGVEGVFLPLFPAMPLDLDPIFRALPAVSIHNSVVIPACPIILHDELNEPDYLWRSLLQRGYERIGIVLFDYPPSETVNLPLGVFLTRQNYYPGSFAKIPFHFFELREPSKERALAWFHEHKPDVIIGLNEKMYNHFAGWGIDIPGQVDFVTFNIYDSDTDKAISGYQRFGPQLFTRGLELLYMMIRTSAVGADYVGLRELIRGDWNEGSTLSRPMP